VGSVYITDRVDMWPG